MKIPAASIDGVDLSRIAAVNPEAAAEVRRIGGLLDYGEETTRDLVLLCGLLFRYGHEEHAELLLRASAVEPGDEIHTAYLSLFGDRVDRALVEAMGSFSRQFDVSLQARDEHLPWSFDVRQCRSIPNTSPAADHLERAAPLLNVLCAVEFRYEPWGCTAEVWDDRDDAPRSMEFLELVFREQSWTLQRDTSGRMERGRT